MNMPTYDFTPIFEALILLLGAVITYFLVPFLKNRLGEYWTLYAVKAAELLYPGPGHGEEKRLYVTEFLKKYHIVVDEQKIRILIEAMVYQIKEEVVKTEVEKKEG